MIMMGNADGVPATAYVGPFQQSGLMPYLYTPTNRNMNISQWPTMGEMIRRNQRVVAMLDYKANETEVPWLLDEFSYQWETPFSPTNPAFPCTVHRPLNQNRAVSRNKMYMVNHNLNIETGLNIFRSPLERDVNFGWGLRIEAMPFDKRFLLPTFGLFSQVNAISGNGSLGRTVDHCTSIWNHPPNWLLVDYYSWGSPFNGSVFQVAASANGVVYNRSQCCRMAPPSIGNSPQSKKKGSRWLVAVLLFACLA